MIEQRLQSAMFGELAQELVASGNSFRFCAHGRSMTPTILDGDILYVEPIIRPPGLGDIVLFSRAGEFKAHRIVGKAGNHFVTRGDAGMEIDGTVQAEQIIGKVVAKECAESGEVSLLSGIVPRMSYFARELNCALRARISRQTWVRRRTSLGLGLLVAIALILRVTAHAQPGGVALDNVNTQGFAVGGGASTCTATPPAQTVTYVCTFTHTDNVGGANSHTLLVVGISMNLKANIDSAVQSMSCNGIGMTPGPNSYPSPPLGFSARAQMFSLANPPVGTCTIVATVSKKGGAGNQIGMVMGAISLSRVNTSGTIVWAPIATGTGTTASAVFSTTGTNDALLDVLAVAAGPTVTTNTSTTSPLVFQTQQWNLTSGVTGQDVEATGSSAGGTGAAVTMRETISSSTAWALAAIDIPAQFPTAVKMQSFGASASNGGALLSWKTGAEFHNLGYNVYRDVGGTKTRLNPSLVAGSALFMRETAEQHGAKSYGWIDASPIPGALYWLEDVDLNGTHTMHGPVSVDSIVVPAPSASSPTVATFSRAHSRQISRESVGGTSSGFAHVLESVARPRVSSAMKDVGYQLAAGPAVKILVDHEGWYRVTQPELASAGFASHASSNSLHLYAEGVEQPIRVTGSGGWFGAQSAIEFYGTAIDTPYSGQRVYWLAQQGKPGLRIPESSALGTAGPQEQFFTQTLEVKPRTTYFAALLRENTDNFFGPLVSPTSEVETISVANFAGGEAALAISLQGVTEAQQHAVTVMLNGSTLGDVTFADQQAGRATFTVPAGALTNGANSITLTAQQGANDLSLVDTITLSFAHTYTAESDLLKFTAEPGQAIMVAGFTHPPTRLIDITNPLHPTRLGFSVVAQSGAYALQSAVPSASPGKHTLLALSDAQLAVPANVMAHAPSRLHVAQPGAEFVVITAPQFSAQMEPLAALHLAEGKSAAVVSIADIYDEFNFGEPSPFAVKTFLKTITSSWTAKPHYLVLTGDASVDPRNYLGFGYFDFVPTRIIPTAELKTASDDWFSDFDGTGIATIATGRLPARTAADAQLMVSKITGYATGATGGWNSQAMLVADADDPGVSFAQAATSVQSLLPSTLTTTDVFAGTLGPATARQNLLDGINSGQLLVNYNGHGSVQVWSGSNIFDDTMATALTNGNKLPVFVIMNCLNGFFHDVYTQSLAESLMLAPNGGAVAVWASSGLTNAEPQFQMNNALARVLFSAPALGDAVLTAKSGIADLDVRRTFILFGDPAMRLRIPKSTSQGSQATKPLPNISLLKTRTP